MKKTISLVISALMLVTATACADVLYDSNLSAESETTATEQSGALNSADYVLNVSYTPIYKDVDFVDELPGSGEPQSYEELQEYMEAYENITFVEYEIISQYSPEEAVEITGSDVFLYGSTLYQAHIYYDYLNDKPLDLTVNLAKPGMPDTQVENNPPYVIGQKLISALTGFSRTRCVAIPELVFYVYDVNDVDLAYRVGDEKMTISDNSFSNLNMDFIGEEYSLMTTTDNNPVKFGQKSTVYDLTQFIKRDWSSRGYKFFDLSSVICILN